jgi:S1-C subfamily serine protease
LRLVFSTCPQKPPQQENDETRKAGLKLTDVIVAVRGYRADTFRAFKAIRDLEPNTPFTLVVWRSKQYIEIQVSPPRNRFGVDMKDYAVK